MPAYFYTQLHGALQTHTSGCCLSLQMEFLQRHLGLLSVRSSRADSAANLLTYLPLSALVRTDTSPPAEKTLAEFQTICRLFAVIRGIILHVQHAAGHPLENRPSSTTPNHATRPRHRCLTQPSTSIVHQPPPTGIGSQYTGLLYLGSLAPPPGMQTCAHNSATPDWNAVNSHFWGRLQTPDPLPSTVYCRIESTGPWSHLLHVVGWPCAGIENNGSLWLDRPRRG